MLTTDPIPVIDPIIVIGTGLAGYSLVREFRKLDTDTPILMLSADDGHSYSKPMLSTGFARQKSADELSMADPGKMVQQLKVSIRNFTRVSAIDPEKCCIYIGDECLPYTSLVLATGASVNKLNFPGSHHRKVISINDLMDYRFFRAELKPADNVLIMGAGLIGCEFANDLLSAEHAITLVDPSDTPMQTLLPEPAGHALALGLQEAGIDLKLQRYVREILELDNGQLCATLNDGHKIICDLVISAIGLKPDLTLARTAKLNCNKGIVTNQFLETSKTNIYALGDCAETANHVRLYVLPLMASARALAQTLAGNRTAVNFGIMPVITKTPACPVVVVPPETDQGEWVFEAVGNGIDVIGRFLDTPGNVRGFVLTGEAVSQKAHLIKEMNNR